MSSTPRTPLDWKRAGRSLVRIFHRACAKEMVLTALLPFPACADQVLASPQTQNLPLLLLANKQDLSESLSPTEIRESYEKWYQAHRSSQDGDGGLEGRGGSLEVLGVSALQGYGPTSTSLDGRVR